MPGKSIGYVDVIPNKHVLMHRYRVCEQNEYRLNTSPFTTYFSDLFRTKAPSIFADWPDVTIFSKINLQRAIRNQSKAQQLFVR